jgi:hypothetical protein
VDVEKLRGGRGCVRTNGVYRVCRAYGPRLPFAVVVAVLVLVVTAMLTAYRLPRTAYRLW